MTRALAAGLALGGLALGGLALGGCMSAELARVSGDVRAAVPEARLARASAPHVGPLGLGLVRPFVDGDTRDLLRSVRGVAVGRYAIGGVLPPDVDLGPAAARLVARGWEPVVVVRDSAEAVQVFARTRGDALEDLLVVALTPGDGLTLVRVRGRLDGDALRRLVGGTPQRRAWLGGPPESDSAGRDPRTPAARSGSPQPDPG